MCLSPFPLSPPPPRFFIQILKKSLKPWSPLTSHECCVTCRVTSLHCPGPPASAEFSVCPARMSRSLAGAVVFGKMVGGLRNWIKQRTCQLHRPALTAALPALPSRHATPPRPRWVAISLIGRWRGGGPRTREWKCPGFSMPFRLVGDSGNPSNVRPGGCRREGERENRRPTRLGCREPGAGSPRGAHTVQAAPTPLPGCCNPEMQEGLSENAGFVGVEFHACKAKRDVSKLPHRLIEKKRRDRINECIAQLKDLLPEHLKLTTLGHLEKAVVLELTLNHLKALTALTEQQHRRIIALQNGDTTLRVPEQLNLDAFRSGFQMCAQEVVQHLTRCDSWTPWDQISNQLIGHLHQAASLPRANGQARALGEEPAGMGAMVRAAGGVNCVPVIRKIQVLEQSGSDTDTDSGYGGEGERCEGRGEGELNLREGTARDSLALKVKQESEDPAAKRVRVAGSEVSSDSMAISMVPTLSHPPPFCLPFYFVAPSAAPPYVPFLDKGGPEKYWCPAPIPFFYPSILALPSEAGVADGVHSSGPSVMPMTAPQRGPTPASEVLCPPDLVS
ncbi:class E basic helix-loop-helix protein 41-like [Narcine bancroftii]|uniref:class E basic helix-loop-helix protein 41-like n=1 Tax=Narcine bancroftii TaxID=1343680 RepID=UPI00383202C8